MTSDAETRFSEVGTGMMRANPEEASIMRRVDDDGGTFMGLRH